MQNSQRFPTTGLNLELFHVQTDTSFSLPPNFTVIRLGKPKDQFIPDIDVSDLPHANFVSRRHAEIHEEDGSFYLVDLGSSNGTYLNNVKLTPKQRHPLQLGDKIDLGHGGTVTFLFLQKRKVVSEFDTTLNNPPTVLQIEVVMNAKHKPREGLGGIVGLITRILNNILRYIRRLLKRY